MYKSKKIILFAFGTLDLKKSINRLKSQAIDSKYYDEIKVMSPSNFDYTTKSKIQLLIKKGKKRGYGYWFWKPHLISKIMEEINEGDIIHYVDIGCHINKTKSNRFYEYLDMLEDSNKWLLAFQYKVNNEQFSDKIEFPKREECKYTKADLLNYFNFLDDEKITHSAQYWAGSFFIKKNIYSKEFIESWINIFEKRFDLVDDTPSKIKNLPGFIENRHDQSVFSLLCKKNSISSLSAYECDWAKKNDLRTWEHILENPILAKRDLEYSLLKRFTNRQIKTLKRIKKKIFNN